MGDAALRSPGQPARISGKAAVSGSGLTHAGIVVGMRALGERVAVHGICVRREASPQRSRVARRVEELAAMIGRSEVVGAGDIDVYDGVHPPDYGKLNGAVGEAMSMAARLDPIVALQGD